MHCSCLFLLIFFLCLSKNFCSQKNDLDPSIEELIQLQGFYPVKYSIQVEDGIFIPLYRIMFNEYPPVSSPPVLFAHGLLTNAGCFVSNIRNQDLAFILADSGYDVWLLSFRGTSESLIPSDKWDFSFTEFAFDIRSSIDHILKQTSFTKITLIGHSEGGSGSVAYLTFPEADNKVNLFVGLAPAIYVSHTKNLPMIAAIDLHLFELIQNFGFKKINGHAEIVDYVTAAICDTLPFTCDIAASVFAGWDLRNIDKNRTSIYTSRLDTSSVHNFIHGSQAYRSGKFQFFDWGPSENMKRYNQSTPPLYPLENIVTPIALYYGEEDIDVDPYDIENYVIPQLKSFVHVRKMQNFNHCDFVFSEDTEFWKEVVSVIDKYRSY